MRMRDTARIALCVVAFLSILLGLTSRAVAQTGSPTQAVGVRDGGMREVLESIFIPPMVKAPFQLTLVTEWSRPLGSDGSYTPANRRRIMRDSEGRIYQERWLLVPKGSKIESTMNAIQIADPVEHVLYNCFVQQKRCDLVRYSGSMTTIYRPDLQSAGPLPDGDGFRTHDDLGSDSRKGCETRGYRDTTTINPGVMGTIDP